MRKLPRPALQIACLMLALSCTVASAGGNELRYRVAGIIYTTDKQLAVIETSNDTQGLYRQGDLLEQFVVDRIDQRGVRLVSGSTEVFLELEGRPTVLHDVAARISVTELEVNDGHATQVLNYRAAADALAALPGAGPSPMQPAGRKEMTGSPAKASAGGERSGTRSLSLAESVNAAVGLPTYTDIQKINRTQISSAAQAVPLLQTELQQGRTVRLEVGGSVAGVNVLYLSADGTTARVEGGE